MGIRLGLSSACGPESNPNPLKFKVRSSEKIGDLWVSQVEYPGCTNYEGVKILVTRSNPKDLTHLDPHFSTDHTINAGLLARFEPTTEGLTLARMFARMAGN